MIGLPLSVSLPKKWPTPFFSNEPTTGGSIFPVLLAIQYRLQSRVFGSNNRKVSPSKSLPPIPGNCVVEYVSMSAAPFRIFVFTSEESNSVQSRQLASRLSRCRLCILHFPTRKSKSLGEELGVAVILSSPWASNSTLGIGILSSAVSSLFCAGAKWESAKTRLMIRQ